MSGQYIPVQWYIEVVPSCRVSTSALASSSICSSKLLLLPRVVKVIVSQGTPPTHLSIVSQSTPPTHLSIVSQGTPPTHLSIVSQGTSPTHLSIVAQGTPPKHLSIVS